MKFIIDIDVGADATKAELQTAIREALKTLLLENGDTLYLEDSAISIKSTD
jgi:hypothetical protein